MEDLRSSVGWLWLKAVNKTFSDLSEDVPWEDQIEDIREVITDLRDQLKVCRARLRNQTSWQDVHTQFMAHQLTWTEAFDALMSQCGMPMEEALSCLAENFDRRPAITAEEA